MQITHKTPEQRLAECQSCLHWLFPHRHDSGRRAAVRAAIHNTVLAGKVARLELKSGGVA